MIYNKCRKCARWRQGMVFLHHKGQEICERDKNKSGHKIRILESHRQRPARIPEENPGRNEKDTRILRGPGSQRHKNRLGHARISPPTRPENTSSICQGNYIYIF